MSFPSLRRGASRVAGACATVAAAACVCGVGASPVAVADPASSFATAITAARAGSGCVPMHYDPVLQRAADIVNRSSEAYFATTSAVTPADTKPQPLPILKDLGSTASKAFMLQGASQVDAMAIKGAVVQGFEAIPDCTYTKFGTSTIYSPTGYSMVVAVLAD